MNVNKGMFIDGSISNKPHSFWEYAKNIMLGDDKISSKPNYAFDELLELVEASVGSNYIIYKLYPIENIVIIFITIDSANNEIWVYDGEIIKHKIRIDYVTWDIKNYLDVIHFYNDKHELIIAWCDGTSETSNRPMILNISHVTYGYSIQDARDLYLFNDFKYINFTANVRNGGYLETGAYFITIRYNLKDGSHTNWMPLSTALHIGTEPDKYNDNSIVINISNLDPYYDSYDVAVLSQIKGAYQANLYADNLGESLTINQLNNEVIDYESILVINAVYNKATSLNLNENRLYLANITNFNDEINYQYLANNIVTHYKTVPSGDTGTFAPGEIYAFAIHFIMKHTGEITKGFHIPGREALDTNDRTSCRDPELDVYYDSMPTQSIDKHPIVVISRATIKIMDQYRDTTEVNITFSGAFDFNLTFPDVDSYENYINEITIIPNYNLNFKSKFIVITSNLDNNGEVVNLSIKVKVNGNLIDITNEFPFINKNIFALYGGNIKTVHHEVDRHNYLTLPSGYSGLTEYRLSFTIDGDNGDIVIEEVFTNETDYYEADFSQTIDEFWITGNTNDLYFRYGHNNKLYTVTPKLIVKVDDGSGGYVDEDITSQMPNMVSFNPIYYSDDDESSKILSYWENKNEIYPVDDIIYYPDGNVRHHRFPDYKAIGGDGDIKSKSCMPKFTNIHIPDEIKQYVDGFIISFHKRDGANRTNWGFANVQSINNGAATNQGSYRTPSIIYGKSAVYASSILDFNTRFVDLGINDHLYRLVSLDMLSYNTNPIITHVANMGYYTKYPVWNSGDPGSDPTNSLVYVDFDGSMVLHIKNSNTNKQGWKLGNVNWDDILDENVAIIPSNTIVNLKEGNPICNEFNDKFIIAEIEDYESALIDGTTDPIDPDNQTLRNYDGSSIYYEPIVMLIKQIHNVYRLTSNSIYILAGKSMVNTNTRYSITDIQGDSYQYVATFNDRLTLAYSNYDNDYQALWLGNYTQKNSNTYPIDIAGTDYYLSGVCDIEIPLFNITSINPKSLYYDENKEELLKLYDNNVHFPLRDTTDWSVSYYKDVNFDINKLNDFMLEGNKLTYDDFSTHLASAIIKSSVLNSFNDYANLKLFKLNDIYYMPYENDEIIKLFGRNKAMFIQQRRALSIATIKDVISETNGATYVGSGELFDRLPSEIIDDQGNIIHCESAYHIQEFNFQYAIIDTYNHNIMIINGDKAISITKANATRYFEHVLKFDNALPKHHTINNGVLIFYDKFANSLFFSVKYGNFDNRKDFTMSFNLDVNNWFSYHTFIPEIAVSYLDSVLSIKNNYIYKHNNINDNVLKYYRVAKDDPTRNINNSIVDLIFNPNDNIDKVFEAVVIDTTVIDENDTILYNETIDGIQIYTNNQCSDILPVTQYHGNNDWYNVDIRNVGFKWFANKFRDAVIDNLQPFIDNEHSIIWTNVDSNRKDWYQLSEINNKFVIVRIIFNNNLNYKQILNMVNTIVRTINFK